MDTKKFKLDVANDNFSELLSPLDDYTNLSAVLVGNLYAIYQASDEFSPEKEIKSIIQRTNSIPALSVLIQRLQGASLTNAANSYLDTLPKSDNISTFPQRDLEAVLFEMCVQHVLGESLNLLFLGSESTSRASKVASSKAWISLEQYSNPRLIQERIRRSREEIVIEIAKLEPILDLVRKEAQSRHELLVKVKDNGDKT